MRVLRFFAAALLAGCAPELPADGWRVDQVRILAVAALPAEATPGQATQLAALVADPQLGVGSLALQWLACRARPGVAEPSPVAAACLGEDPQVVEPIGLGAAVTWTVPSDACGLFGPSPPPAAAGQPAGRPTDPDVTGGYYAPVRLGASALAADPLLFRLRLRCPLASATQAQAVQFNQQYRVNTAPRLSALVVAAPHGSAKLPSTAAAAWRAQVKAGTTVDLQAQWPACNADAACFGAEAYVRFNPLTRKLETQREAVRVSWYSSLGELRDAASGRSSGDPLGWAGNRWTAPAGAAKGWWWLVIRDDRGGVGWQVVEVDVVP